MASPPLYVKRRDSSGATGPGILCDSIAKAIEVAAEFRLKGFPEVWFEDTDGQRIEEAQLRND
jgi:hypothetical protein